MELKKEDLIKNSSPSKIGKAKVASIYPSSVSDIIHAAPQAPFATFNKEKSGEKHYFRTGDKYNVI